MQIDTGREKRKMKRQPKPASRPVQLRIPGDLYERMRIRARQELLPIAAWIRRACATELRKGISVGEIGGRQK
jgi:hypothetical protein